VNVCEASNSVSGCSKLGQKSCSQVFNIHVLRGSLWMNLSGILHKSPPEIHARINTRPEPILKPPPDSDFPGLSSRIWDLEPNANPLTAKSQGKWKANAESSFTDHCLIMNNAIQDSPGSESGSVQWLRMRMSGWEWVNGWLGDCWLHEWVRPRCFHS